jgi:hypothetical protein
VPPIRNATKLPVSDRTLDLQDQRAAANAANAHKDFFIRRYSNTLRDWENHAFQLSLHLRKRFRRPSRQGVGPDFRRHRRSVPFQRPRGARRLRDADHHPARRAGGRGAWQGRRRERRNWAPGAQEEIETAVRNVVREIGYEQDGFHWQNLRISKTISTASRGHRAGRRCHRQQGRRRGRPGHHVRLCLRRDAGPHAGDALLQPQDPGEDGGGPPLGRGLLPGARRQEPGDAALRKRQAGRRDRHRRLHPARAGL